MKPADPFSARLADKSEGSAMVELVGVGNADVRMDAAQERERIVLERLGEGPARRGELVAAIGCPPRTGHRTIADLVKKSLIRGDADGVYRRVEEWRQLCAAGSSGVGASLARVYAKLAPLV